MSTLTKPTTLFPHPFSKEYWKTAALEMKDRRMLVLAALLIALRVALKPVTIVIMPNVQINTATLINALGAMIFGPVVAIPAAVISDTLGCILFPTGTYFFPFVFEEIAGSVIFALFLYRAKVTPMRVVLARFCIDFFVNILMNAPIMWLYYKMILGKSYLMFQLPQILKNLFMFPVESVVITVFLAILMPVTYRLRVTYFYPAKANDKIKFKYDAENGEGEIFASKENGTSWNTPKFGLFSIKDIVVLVVLFLIGVGSIMSYLTYYYNNNSLSASYTADERYAANTKMTEVLVDKLDDYDDMTLVTTVDSAYKKFMGKDVTYNVVVYKVDDAALEGYDKDLETIRGMSKSKAKAVAGDGIMEQVATAVIVLEEKTGEVVSCDVTK